MCPPPPSPPPAQHGLTVAHLAAWYAREGCLQLAISAGADMNARDKVCYVYSYVIWVIRVIWVIWVLCKKR